MITGQTTVYGLLGRPTQHSLSPALHNAWFDEHEIDAVYVAFEVPPKATPHAARLVRGLGLGGVNLTVPFKATVLDSCDRLGELAQAAGAVNVLVRHGSEIVGHNTDAEGFARGFEYAFGSIAGRRAVILGAGGAGRAVAAGLCAHGVGEVVLANRTVARAERAVERLTHRWPRVAMRAAPLGQAALDGADVVVVATAGAAAPELQTLDLDGLPADTAWCDLNYWMADPPCWSAAVARGLQTLDGLPMLVHQGALAFELWTGVRPDTGSALARLRALDPTLPIPTTS